MTIHITLNDHSNPPGKVGDAELRFSEGPLDGLKLIGFSVWVRRGGSGYNVTFPARQYSVNGERRSFALLRPLIDVAAQERVKALIVEAFEQAVESARAEGAEADAREARSAEAAAFARTQGR
jgi:hypothetical protein